MYMDNKVGIDCGSKGWARQGRVVGENWDTCNKTIKNNKIKKK